MAHIDYSKDILKHYIRKMAWLPACVSQRDAIIDRIGTIPLRHFTFCAAEAIDVFMLEKEGIVTRSFKTGRLEGVYFCEKDENAFGKIADYIGSPEQGFLGEFEKIVLFKDDDETEGLDLIEDGDRYYTDDLRRKLQIKDANNRFKGAFPFDIINLDVFGVMFPPKKGIITPLLKSILKIIELQSQSQYSSNASCDQFTLFMTSHIDPDLTDKEVIEQLEQRMIDNITKNESYRVAFDNRYGYQDARRLRNEKFAEFFCYALPKYIIQDALFRHGWEVEYGPIYLYNRNDSYVENKQYQIMHSVSVYKRIAQFQHRLDKPSDAQYGQIVSAILESGIDWVERQIDDNHIKGEIKKDLKSIIDFRDKDRGMGN